MDLPKDSSLRETRLWYTQTRPIYENLTRITSALLTNLIQEAGIDHLSVLGRTKTIDSLVEKTQRKAYRDPRSEVHDLSGLRVIAFIESDVERISDLVKSSFSVHPDKSLDKTAELGIDKTGYRSVHLVCDLGSDRISLPEYASFQGLLIEIQIRTVLQHAWAEIEHDRNFKFSGVLPDPLQRRLYLAAGTLEMIDREFDALAQAIDEYSAAVASATERGELDIPLNTQSIGEYLRARFDNHPLINYGNLHTQDVISELHAFGINSIRDLDRLYNDDFCRVFNKGSRVVTDLGFVRDAMLYADIDRYFRDAWSEHWAVLDPKTEAYLVDRYGASEIDAIFEQYGIIVDEDYTMDE